MTDTNFKKIVETYFETNQKIEERIYKTPRFLDSELEDQYNLHSSNYSRSIKIKTDAFFIFSQLATILYIYVHGYGKIFIYIASAIVLLSLTLIGISHYKKSARFNLFINYVMIGLVSLFLNFKII